MDHTYEHVVSELLTKSDQFDLGNDGLSAKLGFSFLNLYNRQNILSREYFTIYNEETESYTLEERNRDMLRFTPNIVFRLQFE